MRKWLSVVLCALFVLSLGGCAALELVERLGTDPGAAQDLIDQGNAQVAALKEDLAAAGSPEEVAALELQIAQYESQVKYLNESLEMQEQVKETGSTVWGLLVMILPALGVGGVLDRILAGKKYAKEKVADADHYYKMIAHLAKLAEGATDKQKATAALEQNQLGIKADIQAIRSAEGLSAKAA